MNLVSDLLVIIVVSVIILWRIKKRITPWSGGIQLIMGDGSFLPVRFGRPCLGIGAKSVVRGFLLPGALPWMLPEVTVSSLCSRVRSRPQEYRTYLNYESTEAGGSCIILDKPILGEDIEYFMLGVTSAYPWKGCGEPRKRSGFTTYGNHVLIHFDDNVEPYG